MVVSTLLLLTLGLVTAQAQECSKPVAGPNMGLSDKDIVLDTFPDGHKASFRCDVGYTPAGGTTAITCSAGTWSPVRLICERKSCGPLDSVLNGQIDYPNGPVFGEKAVITCNEGHILVGKSEILCVDQGWRDRPPVCEVVKCDPPANIADGQFSPNKDVYEYLEVVQYSCINDNTLNGSRSLSCSTNGKFRPDPPTCIRVECTEPKIENGMWKEGARPPYRHKSAVTLQCNSGYTMKGSSTQTCDINSRWSPGLPQCTPVECKDPKIENGDRKEGSQPPYRYSSTVTFECHSGYSMKGQSTQKCGINGLWSPGLPECILVECKDPKIENGDPKEDSQPPYRYSSTVTFECRSGYIIKGQSTQKCDINGLWSPGLPECEPVECKDPKIENGDPKEDSQPPYRYSSTVTFKCRSGYIMKGQSTQKCDINGLWSPGLPECILSSPAVQCKDPSIEHGVWTKSSGTPHKVSSTVTFECRTGYTLTGSPLQTCGSDGKWSPGLPECKSKASDVGKTVGIVFAVIVIVAGVFICICVVYKKKRSRRHKTDKEAPKAGEDVALS